MNVRIRFPRPLALAAAAAFAAAGAIAPLGSTAEPNQACNQALAYEKVAASDSVTRQAAYDSAIAGLAANQRCSDPQVKLVNEGYLLSMRAAAEHELKIGNWERDVTRANMLLTQCTNWPGLRGTSHAADCETQRRYNLAMTKTLTTIPSPIPVPATPAPSTRPGAAAPPPPPALPAPAAPIPSPTPRR